MGVNPISKMVQLHRKSSKRGLGVKNMKNCEINHSFKNIEEMSVYRKTQVVKQKRGTKGSEIEYQKLEMAD